MSKFFDAPMTITQYDVHDEPVATRTGTFLEIFKKLPDFEKYYYRASALGKHDVQHRVSTTHFGVRTTSIGGFKLTEESFINAYLNSEIQECSKARKAFKRITKLDFSFSYILAHDVWYHNRMRTLAQNTADGFSSALKTFLNDNRCYVPVDDLNEYDHVSGLYLLVIGDHNVCYIGQSDDIRTRVMKHWSRNNYFTGTGIDMFKAYDTTEIYAAAVAGYAAINDAERSSVAAMPSRYTLNCLSGGSIEYLMENGYSIGKVGDPSVDFVDYVCSGADPLELAKIIYPRFCV